MYDFDLTPLLWACAIAGAVATLLVVFPGWWFVSWLLQHIHWVA